MAQLSGPHWIRHCAADAERAPLQKATGIRHMTDKYFRIASGFALSTGLAFAQLGGAPPSGGGGSVAAQLPVSGRTGQSGAVVTTQSPVPGTTSSVNTLNSGVSISGNYS